MPTGRRLLPGSLAFALVFLAAAAALAADTPAEAAAPAPVVPVPAAPAAAARAAALPGPSEPLAGFSKDWAFIRSPANTFVLFPQFRLDVDAALFPRQTPKSGVFI